MLKNPHRKKGKRNVNIKDRPQVAGEQPKGGSHFASKRNHGVTLRGRMGGKVQGGGGSTPPKGRNQMLGKKLGGNDELGEARLVQKGPKKKTGRGRSKSTS